MQAGIRNLILTAFALVIVTGFQNCAKSGAGDASASGAGAPDQVVAKASQFNRVIYDPALEAGGADTPFHMTVDVSNGVMSLTITAGPKQCSVDSARLAALQSLLDSASVCQPPAPPAGTMECMAIALPDIELLNPSESVFLSQVVCNQGNFLCDGADELLRSLLNDLKSNPPAGCN